MKVEVADVSVESFLPEKLSKWSPGTQNSNVRLCALFIFCVVHAVCVEDCEAVCHTHTCNIYIYIYIYIRTYVDIYIYIYMYVRR